MCRSGSSLITKIICKMLEQEEKELRIGLGGTWKGHR